MAIRYMGMVISPGRPLKAKASPASANSPERLVRTSCLRLPQSASLGTQVSSKVASNPVSCIRPRISLRSIRLLSYLTFTSWERRSVSRWSIPFARELLLDKVGFFLTVHGRHLQGNQIFFWVIRHGGQGLKFAQSFKHNSNTCACGQGTSDGEWKLGARE